MGGVIAIGSLLEVYLPIAQMPVSIFVILGVGAAVGFISGMFGVGGGFLMTPMLIFLGIPSAVVVATEASQIAASSLTGAIAYWRKGAVDFRLAAVLIVGGLIGTQCGVMFFNGLRARGQLDLVIVLSYVILLGGIGLMMLVESIRAVLAAQKGEAAPTRRAGRRFWYEKLPLRLRFPRSGLYISLIPLTLLAFCVAFAGAVLGIGGGFIMVPALIYGFRVPTHIVVGTSLMQILCTMIAATILHALTNYSVDLVLAALLIVGGVFGAQFGARAGANLRGEYFRLLLALMIFGVAMRFALDVLQKPEDPFTATVTETAR